MKQSLPMILALTIMKLVHASGAAAVTPPSAADSLQAWLAPIAIQAADRSLAKETDPLVWVARFYRHVGYRPIWTGADGLLPQGETLMQVMAMASREGLFADAYRLSYPLSRGLRTVLYPVPASRPRLAPYLRLDVMLSDAMLQIARHLSQGRIAPEDLYGQWQAWRRPPKEDLPVELARAVSENRLFHYVESLHPQGLAYRALRKALAKYERIKQAGGWPMVAPGPTLRPGDTGPRVEALQQRLAVSGDGGADRLAISTGFDTEVEAAVKRFQHRHGLHADGLVGERTLAELNVPVEVRITSLKLNMERWRWFPDDLGDRHLLVNIPAFALSLVADGTTIDHQRAIVGREDRQTPVMSGRITYLEFNPYWNIPQKIARQDILPRAVSDPDYLTRQGIRVFGNWDDQAPELDPSDIAWETFSDRYFPYRLRQDPSGRNALGQVKFMFPNPRSIYIHDTPAKSLFDRRERDFSSGCVRVETPLALALHLLRSQGWDRDRLQAAVGRGQQRTVLLDEPVPVHLVYFTAWVDEDDRLNFRQDIYGRDRQLLRVLADRDSGPVLCAKGDQAHRTAAICAAAQAGYRSTADTPLPELPGPGPDRPTQNAPAVDQAASLTPTTM